MVKMHWMVDVTPLLYLREIRGPLRQFLHLIVALLKSTVIRIFSIWGCPPA